MRLEAVVEELVEELAGELAEGLVLELAEGLAEESDLELVWVLIEMLLWWVLDPPEVGTIVVEQHHRPNQRLS